MATGDNALLGEVGIGSTLIGGITSAVSGFVQGEAQKQMYDYQAGIARLNAQIAQQNSDYTLNVGEAQAQRAGLAGGQRMGEIRAAQGASGLDVNSGSAKQVQTSQKQLTQTDVASIRSTAAKTAYNYRVQATGLTAQANLDTVAGQNARTAGMLNAGSSLISTATSVSNEWLRGSQLGLWDSPGGSGSGQSLGGSGSGGIGAA